MEISKRNSTALLIFFPVTLLLVQSFFAADSHLAYAESFQILPVRLQHSPTICAIEPQPDSNFQGIGKQLLDETQYSVMDWNMKLNQGLGKKPVWNISLVKVPLVQQKGFDYSKCDITIQYLLKPQIKEFQMVLAGITIPNLETGKTNIEIYYADVQSNWQMVEWWDGRQEYYTYVNNPIYTGHVATTTQIDSTTRHEIGHALGLGHYMVPNDELKKIVQGTEDMPSIMIPMDTALGITHFDITGLDISEMKSIYGNGGFDNQSPSNQVSKRVPLLGTDKSTYQGNDTIKLSIDTSLFDNNTSGVILVIDSDNHLKGDLGISKSNSTVYLNNISDKNGKYWIEFMDPKDTVYDYASFVVGSEPSQQPIMQQTSPVLTQIPSWIKSNAKWWSEGSINNDDFIKGIQYLIQQKILTIPPTQSSSASSNQIPTWIKNNAGWWASGQINDDDFVKGIQYLISNGIIKV